MASFVYNATAAALAAGTLVWTTDVIKARIIKSTATLNADDTTMTPATKITGSTDQTLSDKTIATDTATDRQQFKQSTIITWTAVAAGETVSHIVVFKFVTDDAGSTPLFAIDVTDVPTNGGNLTWTPAGNIVAYLQQ